MWKTFSAFATVHSRATFNRDMERVELEHTLERFRAELAEAEIAAQTAVQRRDSLRQVVVGFEGLLAARIDPGRRQLTVSDEGTGVDAGSVTARLTAPESDAKPAGAEAVRRVLRDADKTLSLKDILRELNTRGWMSTEAKHPEASVRSSLQRLVADGAVIRVARGTYRLKTPETQMGSP